MAGARVRVARGSAVARRVCHAYVDDPITFEQLTNFNCAPVAARLLSFVRSPTEAVEQRTKVAPRSEEQLTMVGPGRVSFPDAAVGRAAWRAACVRNPDERATLAR